MKKLTFLCSFGGDFAGDRHRYVGGDTRLVSIDRRGDVTLPRLLSKLSSVASPHSFKIVKYQLRESSSLVPIASDEDVRRMVEDYDALAAAGSLHRLRIFLCDVKPRNPRFTPLSLGDSNHQKWVLAKDAHGNKQLRVSRGCRKSPTLSGFPAGASPRQSLFPNYMTETCSGKRSLVGNCQHSRIHHQLMTKTSKFSPSTAESLRIDRRICMPKCPLGSRPSAYGLPALTKKKLRAKPLDYVHPYLHRKNGRELSSDTSRHCGLEFPLDISMHQLSLSSSVRACPQLPYSSASSDIRQKHIATSPRQIEQIETNNKGEDGVHLVSKINKSMKVSDEEAALFQGQVSVDMKNEAAYTWKDQETMSSTSNVEEKANGAVTSICFEGAGKTSCDLLSRYAHLADQGLQTIHESDLEQMKELGSGAFGTVFYGKWKGSDVAIKRLKPGCISGAELEDKLVSNFWKEARLLSQLHHPNVLAFYGVVTDGPMTSLATVTEYMVNGSLKQVLQRKDRTIDRRKRVIIAMDAAFGMEYLHDKKVVHFDLNSRNLLVNIKDPHRPVCKIGDLGLSKVKRRTLISGGVRGTIPWMAPELLSSENMVTEKVDVYSFGIVMWELLTGEEPYQNMRSQEIIGGMLEGSLRPEIPSWCDPAWRSLMERCWSSDPGLRPSFSEIAKELRAIAASMNIK